MTDYLFIEYVKNFCYQNNIRYITLNRKIKDLTDGYFALSEDNKPFLVISNKTSKLKLLHVVIHEFGHILQWLENPTWFQDPLYDPYAFDKAIKNQDIQNANYYLHKIIEIESSNAKQLANIIKEYKLENYISIDYINRVENWILYQYIYVSKYFVWPCFKKPFKSHKQWYQFLIDNNIPNNFKRKYKYLPRNIKELMDEIQI